MPATMSILGLIEADHDVLLPIKTEMPTQQIADEVECGICACAAELEILYPSPPVLKRILTLWAQQRSPIWAKLYQTTQIEYNPTYNYDRTETETITRDREGTSESTQHTDAQSSGQSDARTTSNATTNASAARYGYNNANSPSPESTSTQTDNGSDVTLTGDSTSASGSSNGSTHDTESGSESRSVRAYGNIGVVTTDEMIAQYRQTQQFDFVQFVVDDFIGRFCVLVY